MTKTILITGANGNVSTALLGALKGSKTKLRAMVRDESKAKGLRDLGLEVVLGDLELPATLESAFEGVTHAWLLTNNGPRSTEHMSKALWAARQAGVQHVVRMSAVGAAHNAPTINSRLHALSDAELVASGIPYTILRPHFFTQNLLGWAPQVAQEGTLYAALGDGRLGMVDVRDIAEFAANVLTTGGHLGKTYTLTGPKSVSMVEFAEALTTTTKKTVRYVPVTLEQARESMTKWGMDTYAVGMMSDYFKAYSEGWGDFVTTDVQNVLGRPARSVLDFAKDFGTAFLGK